MKTSCCIGRPASTLHAHRGLARWRWKRSSSPNQGITAHFLTQAGTVGGRRHAPSPEQNAQAEAVGRIFADFVRKATFSIHIAVYDFRLTGAAATELVGALNERARAGVDVRIAYHHPKRDRTPEVFAWIGQTRRRSAQPISSAPLMTRFRARGSRTPRNSNRPLSASQSTRVLT